jgi:hypothetical protein
MVPYRTDLRAWLLDELDFILEQIELARSPSDQAVAVATAREIVPRITSRLQEDKYLNTQFALLFGDLMFNNWQETWTEMAKEPTENFTQSADDLVKRVNTAKELLQSPHSK